MKKLWISYAWSDNTENEFDFLVQELEGQGLDVSYDRAELLAGRRLWAQIEKKIADPSLDAWGLFVTENSLRSEPCQEELAYALDRALRQRGSEFPLIGIFPNPIPRELIPSAIAIRKYVSLSDPNWRREIVAGVVGKGTTKQERKPLDPFCLEFHSRKDSIAVEFWPRLGMWGRAIIAVPASEKGKLNMIMPGPRGLITGTGMASGGEWQSVDGKWVGWHCQGPINSSQTAHVFFKDLPSEFLFGGTDGDQEILYSWKPQQT